MITSQHWSAGFRRSPSRGPSPTGSGLSNGSKGSPTLAWSGGLGRSGLFFNSLPSAAAGQVDTGFWNRIFRIQKPGGSCEVDSASGWFGLFSPYLSVDDGQSTQRNAWLAGDRDIDVSSSLKGRPGGRSSLKGSFPAASPRPRSPGMSGRGTDRLIHRWDMQLLAGFVGVAQDAATFRLRPEIGWAVRERSRP